MKNEDMCLIITGTIKPSNDVFALAVSDSGIREKQYLNSIKYYIEKTKIKKIIFCDNSGFHENAGLNELARECNKELEWISFIGDNAMVSERGKGFGECEIMNRIFSTSKLINTCSSFVKVTGRLIVKNIDLVIWTAKKNNIYCDIYQDMFLTYFYLMPVETYASYFTDANKNVDDKSGVFLEHCYYRIILDNRLKPKMFSVYPNINGVSGSTGKSYYLSLGKRFKKIIKGNIYNFYQFIFEYLRRS